VFPCFTTLPLPLTTKPWQQTLRAPAVRLKGTGHILNVVLFSNQLPPSSSYDVQVEGWNQKGWQPLGHLLFNPLER
jgi:hypothetical protein